MITNLLSNYPWLYSLGAFLAWFANALLERWLGRTEKTKAASVLDFIELLGEKLAQRFTRRKTVPNVSANPNTVAVTVYADKAMLDILNLLNDILQKLFAGAKPQEIAAAELGAIMQVLNEVGTLPADAKADPATVMVAIEVGLNKIGQTLQTKFLAAPPK